MHHTICEDPPSLHEPYSVLDYISRIHDLHVVTELLKGVQSGWDAKYILHI